MRLDSANGLMIMFLCFPRLRICNWVGAWNEGPGGTLLRLLLFDHFERTNDVNGININHLRISHIDSLHIQILQVLIEMANCKCNAIFFLPPCYMQIPRENPTAYDLRTSDPIDLKSNDKNPGLK